MPNTPEGIRLSQAVLESARAVVEAFSKRPQVGTPEFKALQKLLQDDIAINQAYLEHLKGSMENTTGEAR